MGALVEAGAQQPEAREPAHREVQDSDESGVCVGLLRGILCAADPQSRQAFTSCVCHDAFQQRAVVAAPPVLGQGHAVPDVGLAGLR